MASFSNSSSSSSSSSFILFDAWIKAQCLLLDAWSAVLSSPPVQTVLEHLVCPLVEPVMLVEYGVLRYIVEPWCQMILPRRIQRFVTIYYLPTICWILVRIPLLSVALQRLFKVLLLALTKRTNYYSDLRLFLHLQPPQAVRLGSGSFYNPDNCFFPTALSRGPSGTNSTAGSSRSSIDSHTVMASSINNLHISQTLLYMCILSYHPHLYRPCIQAGMFPGTSYYTTRGKNMAHILCHQTWAVIIVNPIAACDWWNLLWDDATVDMATSMHNVHWGSTTSHRARVRERYHQAMLRAGNSPLQYHQRPPSSARRKYSQQHDMRTVTVFQFLRYLSQQGHKLYATGHSLGGGVANLLAVHMKLAWNVDMAAVVSFGAPPVSGNQAFLDLYDQCINVAWRFENGVEIGPLLPPLPFFCSETQFGHVGRRLHLQTIMQKGTATDGNDARNELYSLAYMDAIAETEQLPSMFLDHNPFETLRHLQEASTVLHNRQSHELWSERMRGMKEEMTSEADNDDWLTDTDSDTYYSAHGSTPLGF